AVEAAMAMPGARILAVDLSRASLAYGALKTQEMGLADRLTFAQADLLELADLRPRAGRGRGASHGRPVRGRSGGGPAGQARRLPVARALQRAGPRLA